MANNVYMGFLYQIDESKKPIKYQSKSSLDCSKVPMSGNYVLFELVKPALGKPYARELITGKKIPIISDDIKGGLNGEHTFLKFDGAFDTKAPIASKEALLNYCYYHQSPELYLNFLNSVLREGEDREEASNLLSGSYEKDALRKSNLEKKHMNETLDDIKRVCDVKFDKVLDYVRSLDLNNATQLEEAEVIIGVVTNESNNTISNIISDCGKDFNKISRYLADNYKLSDNDIISNILNETIKENSRLKKINEPVRKKFDVDKAVSFMINLGMLKDEIKENKPDNSIEVKYDEEKDSKAYQKADRVVSQHRIKLVGTLRERDHIADDLISGSYRNYLNNIEKPTEKFELTILNEEISSGNPTRLVKGQFGMGTSSMYTPPFITEGYGVLGSDNVVTSGKGFSLEQMVSNSSKNVRDGNDTSKIDGDKYDNSFQRLQTELGEPVDKTLERYHKDINGEPYEIVVTSYENFLDKCPP